MESNRDESERCFDIAQKYIALGSNEKALKFLHKAEKLYPTHKVRNLINQIHHTVKSTQNARATSSHRSSPLRGDCNTGSRGRSISRDRITYSKEDIEAVKRIKCCKDYYEILSITREASNNEIKKSYRKLALQFHPDKNKTPGAGEAFKAIGNAFATLSDPQKRKLYDLRGSALSDDDRVTHRHAHHNRRNGDFEYDYSRGFDAEMSAEDIFNLFSAVDLRSENLFRSATAFSRPRRDRTTFSNFHTNDEQPNHTIFLQMLPIIILILLSFFSNFFVSDPSYKFQPTAKYHVHRTTADLHVPYYVKENFEEAHQNSIPRLEKEIERAYYNLLEKDCYDQMSQKAFLLRQAEFYGNPNLREKAQQTATPSCDLFNKFRDQIQRATTDRSRHRHTYL